MIDPPAVTVLMVVYNGARFLDTAIDSILGQSFTDFEFVIVDDGSSDSTPNILSQRADPRLKVLTNVSNIGLTRSLNEGLRVARGRYIARIDADDVAHPERLAKQVHFLCAHPDHILVGSSFRKIDSDGKVTQTVHKPMDDLELRWVSTLRTALEHSSVTFCRLSPTGEPYFYDERFSTAQDAEMWPRLLEDGKGAVLGELLLDYRSHEDAVTARLRTNQLDSLASILLEFAETKLGAGPEHRSQLKALFQVYHARQSISPELFRSAVHGLNWLIERFADHNKLTHAERRSIACRGAGQLWHSIVRSKSVGRTNQASGLLGFIRLMWIGRSTLPAAACQLISKVTGTRAP